MYKKYFKDTHRLEVKGWKKSYHVDNKHRWSGVAISDKTDFNTRNITEDKERNFIIIKGKI